MVAPASVPRSSSTVSEGRAITAPVEEDHRALHQLGVLEQQVDDVLVGLIVAGRQAERPANGRPCAPARPGRRGCGRECARARPGRAAPSGTRPPRCRPHGRAGSRARRGTCCTWGCGTRARSPSRQGMSSRSQPVHTAAEVVDLGPQGLELPAQHVDVGRARRGRGGKVRRTGQPAAPPAEGMGDGTDPRPATGRSEAPSAPALAPGVPRAARRGQPADPGSRRRRRASRTGGGARFAP